jgi:hypothetical protein
LPVTFNYNANLPGQSVMIAKPAVINRPISLSPGNQRQVILNTAQHNVPSNVLQYAQHNIQSDALLNVQHNVQHNTQNNTQNNIQHNVQQNLQQPSAQTIITAIQQI